MSVIAEVTVPPESFELGQILCVGSSTRVVLETVVPLSGQPTPFVRIRNTARERFEQSVREHQSVKRVQAVNTQNNETLYAVEWQPSGESLLSTLMQMDVTLLHSIGTTEHWTFELRFPTHEAFSAFQEYCTERDIQIVLTRMYMRTAPTAGPWYGLTEAQRETLTHAVRSGYYAVPREISTKAVAAEFDISDQAVTERLRRGIDTLVSNTLLATDSVADQK
jgi:predicted DNA binding protein